jgi:hypothetical protein
MTTRRILLCCSTLAGLALGTPGIATSASAQTPAGAPGGPPFGANPTSTKASNLPTSTITSPIAPQLPSTGLGPNATIGQFLSVARSALTEGKTGLAQEALENAETLALTRSVPFRTGNVPDSSSLVGNIRQARGALGRNDLAEAGHFTDLALQEAGK